MYKIRFRLGFPPQTPFWELTALLGWWSLPPDPLAALRGPTSKGEEGRVNEAKTTVEKGVWAPNLHHRSTPLVKYSKRLSMTCDLRFCISCVVYIIFSIGHVSVVLVVSGFVTCAVSTHLQYTVL